MLDRVSRSLCLVALVALLPTAAGAKPNDPCGNAALVSQAYTAVPATVLAVDAGDRMQVRVDAGKYVEDDLVGTYAVRLVAIEAPSYAPLAAQSRDRLAKRVRSKQVYLLISPFQEEGTPRNVMIQTPRHDYDDENLGQLAAGMARVVEQGAYDVDWYTRCTYERAQEAAQQAGRGMWSTGR